VLEGRQRFDALLARIKKGDERAMQILMEQYDANLQRMADRLIGKQIRRHVDPEDIVNPVKLQLWDGLRRGQFDLTGPEQLLALARTLLRRQVSRHCRSAKASPSATQEFSLDSTLADQPLMPASKEPDPRSAAEHKDTFAHILAQIEPIDRSLLKLRSLGYATVDAARVMQVDPGFLRMRLLRLRERYAHLLPSA